jgi:hypothetical protein
MMSFHESHHAFLNASTTLGIAVIYCGALVELNEKPFIALSNATRIAMQTPIYAWLPETPCERWHELALESWNAPDQRFKTLLERDVIRDAKEAIRQIFAQSDSPLKVFSEQDAGFKAD